MQWDETVNMEGFSEGWKTTSTCSGMGLPYYYGPYHQGLNHVRLTCFWLGNVETNRNFSLQFFVFPDMHLSTILSSIHRYDDESIPLQ